MALQYFCQIKGKEFGPMSGSQLSALAQVGKLSATDMVRPENSDRWMPAGRIRNLVFGTVTPEQDEIEEIPEVQEVNTSPNQKQVAAISQPDNKGLHNNNILPPPAYAFIEFVINAYNLVGVLLIVGAVFAFIGILANADKEQVRNGVSIGSAIGVLFCSFLGAISIFAIAQMLTMAIRAANNLHQLNQSNLQMLRIMSKEQNI